MFRRPSQPQDKFHSQFQSKTPMQRPRIIFGQPSVLCLGRQKVRTFIVIRSAAILHKFFPNYAGAILDVFFAEKFSSVFQITSHITEEDQLLFECDSICQGISITILLNGDLGVDSWVINYA